MSVYREGEFLFISFQGVVVKYKGYSVYVQIDKFGDKSLTGLCGNANFDTSGKNYTNKRYKFSFVKKLECSSLAI